MEKKTIGSLITVLRKANGMTQKDLAERLNVSDKTVSRWERDDGAPDLAVIPVIAEIFGVTCDELLRGERKFQEEREETTSKGEKQRQRILAVSLSKYQNRTFIAMGIAVTGLIAAMIGNLGFLRAYIGFFISTVFYLAALICQAIFVNQAFLSVADESLNDMVRGQFKHAIVRLAEYSIGLTIILFGFSLPLAIFPYDTYVGLEAKSWLLHGMAFGVAACLIVGIICYFLNAQLLKKGICVLSEKATGIYQKNHVLKRKCALVLSGGLFVTFIIHMSVTTIWGPWSIMEGISFEDYESFADYMEQDIPYQDLRYQYGISSVEVTRVAIGQKPVEEITYYDEFGNVISEEQAFRRTIEDDQGNVLCEYVGRNEMVCSIRYGSGLPITVYTYDALWEAEEKAAVRNVIFGVMYGVEIIVGLAVYFRKRAR